MRPLRVGDLVRIKDLMDSDPCVLHHGAGLVTDIKVFDDDELRYPLVTVKWLKSQESFVFLPHDLQVLHEA